jgi:hypothetical protein
LTKRKKLRFNTLICLDGLKIYKYEKSNYIIITVIRLAHKCKPSRKRDVKGQVGLNLQDGGTGIFLSSDFGIGENMSLGLTANYLLSVNEDAWEIFLILDNE